MQKRCHASCADRVPKLPAQQRAFARRRQEKMKNVVEFEPMAEPACFFFTHALRIELKVHENLNFPDIQFDIHGDANQQQICDAVCSIACFFCATTQNTHVPRRNCCYAASIFASVPCVLRNATPDRER